MSNRITPHLTFNGNCKEAIDFYARCFGAKQTFCQIYGNSPMKDEMPAAMHSQVIHADLQIGGGTLYACDVRPDDYAPAECIYVFLPFDSAEAAHKACAALLEGESTLNETGWAEAFGMVQDKFGVRWILGTSDTFSPVPVTPFAFLKGTGMEALEFYSQCFGGEQTFCVTYGDSGMADQMPAGMSDQIMRAELRVGDGALRISDVTEEHFPHPMQGTSVSFSSKDGVEAKRVFAALSEGAEITMPFEKTFWSEGFGSLVDRFGLSWSVDIDAD